MLWRILDIVGDICGLATLCVGAYAIWLALP